MNKKFSTLVATLLLSGALFSVNAQIAINHVENGWSKEEIVEKKGALVGLNLAEDHALPTGKYVVVDQDNFVLDGNGKTIFGRLVITGKNVTVKNVTINYAQDGNSANGHQGNGAVNKTAITVIAPSVNLENVTVLCNVKPDVTDYVANGITVFPTSKKAKLNFKDVVVKNAANTVNQWSATGVQIIEKYDLKNTWLDEEFMPTVEQSVVLNKDFDAKAVLDGTKYENCGVDFTYAEYVFDNQKQTNKTIQFTPIYDKAGYLQNTVGLETFLNESVDNATLIFNGTLEEMTKVMSDPKFAEVPTITTVAEDGSLVKADVVKYEDIVTSKTYYTIQTENGLLDGDKVAVKDDAMKSEYVWGFTREANGEGFRYALQNVESGIKIYLPNLEEANIFATGENTYTCKGVTFTLNPTNFDAKEYYQKIENELYRHDVYNLGIYSPVWGGVSYFTENHAKPSHIIGLDPKAIDNGTVSEWTFKSSATHNVTRSYWWYDETKEKGQVKGWTENKVEIKVPTYILTNQYDEQLGWDGKENKFAAQGKENKDDVTVKSFIFKKVGEYYNMVAVNEGKGESLLANDVKVYGAHSAELGFLAEIDVYNRTENDLVYISPAELTYDYRHLTASEKLVSFFEVNEPSISLWEDNKNGISLLAAGNACTGAETLEMLSHMVYEPKTESGLAQYLLAVRTEEIESDTIWCNATQWHKHETLEDSLACEHTHIIRGSLHGDFLVSYADSAAKFNEDGGFHNPNNANPYEYSNMPRLGFVEATHVHGIDVKDEKGNLVNVEDTLIIASDNNKLLVENKNFNEAKFAFRYVEPQASVHEDADFYIETQGGDLRVINDIVVIDKKGNGTAFSLKANGNEGGDTANEDVAVSEVKVLTGNGNVTIAGAAGKKVVISNILGQVVANTVITSDNATIAAPAGVVVVAVEGETAVKAIVK